MQASKPPREPSSCENVACRNNKQLCVRFPQNVNELNIVISVDLDVSKNEEEERHQKQLQWYSQQDCKNFKRSAETTAKDAVKKGYSMFLKNTFKGVSNNASSNSSNSNVTHFITTITQAEQDDVNGWALSSFRGLETYTCRRHGYARYEAKLMQLKTVISAQQFMMSKYGYVDSYTLCQIAEKHSFVARQFAHSLGIADENAVKPQPIPPSPTNNDDNNNTVNEEEQHKNSRQDKRKQIFKQQSWSSLAA
mmetsp:Transcript_14477/g.20417  ORF Transcript_14477/g.20417 Transcript_14477/m.20417 type:complete len:251 (+) Transcript_14477:56-808(+)